MIMHQSCTFFIPSDTCLHWLLMQDYKRNVLMEADIRCSNAVQSMERRLRAACHSSDANIDNVVKVSLHCLVFLSIKELPIKTVLNFIFFKIYDLSQ